MTNEPHLVTAHWSSTEPWNLPNPLFFQIRMKDFSMTKAWISAEFPNQSIRWNAIALIDIIPTSWWWRHSRARDSPVNSSNRIEPIPTGGGSHSPQQLVSALLCLSEQCQEDLMNHNQSAWTQDQAPAQNINVRSTATCGAEVCRGQEFE